jgi:UDP-glucose 4-epimerase
MPLTMKRTLVTGGAGFIGSHVARRLLALGCEVRIVDNLATGRRENLAEIASEVEFREADLCTPGVAGRIVDGIDTIFHIAALPSVPRSIADPIGTHDANVNATVHLLEAARRAGVRRLVFSSSSSVYGDTPTLPKVESMEPMPRSPYAAAKLSAEQYTLAYARAGLLECVALRYFNVFGARQDPNGPYAAVVPLLMRAALTATPMTIFGDGEQTRDFTFIDNVVDANLLAATGERERVNGWTCNVGAGERTSLLGLVRLAEEVTGRRIAITHRPPREGDVRDSLASLERAHAVLGYHPAVSLRDGLERLWGWTQDSDAADLTTAQGVS